jgi:hypothetical protein
LVCERHGDLGWRKGKLAPYDDWMVARAAENGDLTQNEIVVAMPVVHGVTVHRSSMGKWLYGLTLAINAACQRTSAFRGG